uniref:DDE-1 domain-containing protein n=1 Tax=Plectus sambesii TaxID=2011161 RepID=A0A914WMQ7_9BILA
MKVDMAVIPGGCMKFMQAPDVSWNKPFKQKIEEYYNEWLLNGEMAYTLAGNMRAPPMETYLQWVVDAWNLLPTDLIKNSFKCCSVSNATDDSEDHLIHVFKQDCSCPEGMVLLTEAMKKMEEGNIVFVEEEEEKEEEEDDLNQNIDNGDDNDYSIELY